MNIYEILKAKDNNNPLLSAYRCEPEEAVVQMTSTVTSPILSNVDIEDPVNIEDAMPYVGKSMARSYHRGEISVKQLLASYHKNRAEAETFCTFGYRIQELQQVIRTTHNPALKAKLQDIVSEKKILRQKSNLQNQVTLNKLDAFKRDVLGMGIGLRKIISSMRRYSKISRDLNARIVTLLLETEFANVNAKRLSGEERKKAYQRKVILLTRLSQLLQKAGWKSGYNEATGKNASYLTFVYLPNGIQLTWHCNEYTIPEHFELVDDVWDGQVCMTMEKILTYIKEHYSHIVLPLKRLAA